MTLHLSYIGCDISKRMIDVFDPRSGAQRFANTPESCADFAAGLAGSPIMVVMEATGPYDEALREALAAAGVQAARVNPMRARRFAQAAGLMAKTDTVDARMLAFMGRALGPRAEEPQDEDRKALTELHKRRDQLVQMRAQEKNRAHQARGDIHASLMRLIATLDAEIAGIEQCIREQIARSATLKTRLALLRTAPGVGEVTAVTLTALAPELGRLSSKQIAALAGLAPIACDSGAFRGLRRIGHGRTRIRRALYMAAMAAKRYSPRFAAFYERLVAAGKPRKVAVIAVARKLIVVLNAMLRDNKAFA
jgi:transposase